MVHYSLQSHSHERRWKLLPQIHANLVFQACVSFFEVFQGIWHSNKRNPSVSSHATMSCPLMAQIMQICMSFRSRSDLVLDAEHSLYFLPCLVLQPSDKSGALLVLPCSHKNAVARIFTPITRIVATKGPTPRG